MASTQKPRQPRLRASCDGCFIAKVKCTKARPACHRCLTSGIECRYSPSSRVGKPKADHSHVNHSNVAQRPLPLHPAFENGSSMLLNQSMPSFTDGLWSMSSAPIDGNFVITSDLLGDGQVVSNQSEQPHQQLYHQELGWDSPPGIVYGNPSGLASIAQFQRPYNQSQSFNTTTMSTPTSWADAKPPEVISYPQVQTPISMSSQLFPSPTAQATMSNGSYQNPLGCRYIGTCVTALGSLQNASVQAGVSLDTVLQTVTDAIGPCHALMAHPTCFTGNGAYAITFLLFAVMGKAISIVTSTARSYAGQATITAPGNTPRDGMSNRAVSGFMAGTELKRLQFDIMSQELLRMETMLQTLRPYSMEVFQDIAFSTMLCDHMSQGIEESRSALDRIYRETGLGAMGIACVTTG